jgi:hypothetical protein
MNPTTPQNVQHLTILLDGITAGDYLTWVHDPEPHTQGRGLRSFSTVADPLDDRIHVMLIWGSDPPPPRAAAIAAGFALTPEIMGVQADAGLTASIELAVTSR